MDKKKALTLHCSVEATIAVLGGKYKAIILWHLNVSGVMRYNEIQKAIPQATAKMLSQQLKELENDGIVKRKLYPVVPPRTEYSLVPARPQLRLICQRIRLAFQRFSSSMSSGLKEFGDMTPRRRGIRFTRLV